MFQNGTILHIVGLNVHFFEHSKPRFRGIWKNSGKVGTLFCSCYTPKHSDLEPVGTSSEPTAEKNRTEKPPQNIVVWGR